MADSAELTTVTHYYSLYCMSSLTAIFLIVTQIHSLPAGLISAICYTESRHAVHAVNLDDGGSPSLGACQIKLGTARLLGFRGTQADLRRPETNAHWAAAYLAYQLRRYNGDVGKAIAAYNSGTHRVNARGLTMNRKYVGKVMAAWAEGR